MTIPKLDCEIKFQIHLQCAERTNGQINWNERLKNMVAKRISESKMNLANFCDDIDLGLLSVTLSTFCMTFILKHALKINSGITSISFQSNKIKHIVQELSNFTRLKCLDLSNNDIEDFRKFPKLFNVTEVSLDRNPICLSYYKYPWRLVEHSLLFFPNLQTIDNRTIDQNSKTVFMRNYLVSQKSFTFAESFVKFFFNMYDSHLRQSLKKLYDDNSLFSMSDSCVENSKNSLDTENIFIGREKITSFFESLPRTTHDFTTFCVDVPSTTERNVLITVNGFFKIMSESVNIDDEESIWEIRSFTRTFFLEQKNEKKGALPNTFRYRIKNEALTVCEISTDTSTPLKLAFTKTVATEADIKRLCKDLLPSQAENQEVKVSIFKEMTYLNEIWCRRYDKL
jgi:hypothetical protein